MANNLEIAMMVVAASATLISIIMSFINGKEEKKIRQKHIDEFLERREERKKTRRDSL